SKQASFQTKYDPHLFLSLKTNVTCPSLSKESPRTSGPPIDLCTKYAYALGKPAKSFWPTSGYIRIMFLLILLAIFLPFVAASSINEVLLQHVRIPKKWKNR